VVEAKTVAKLSLSILLIVVMIIGVYEYRSPKEPSPEMAILPWGPTVIGYIFFALLSGGIADSAIIHTYLEKNKASRVLLGRSLYTALAVLVPGIALVFSDILHPENAAWFYRGFNPLSRIAWNAVLYLLYGGSLLLLLLVLARSRGDVDKPLAKLLALLVLATSVTLEVNLGMAYGVNIAVPAWYGLYTGILFVVAAFTLGSAWELVTSRKPESIDAEDYRKLARSYTWENFYSTIILALVVFWSLLALYSWGLSAPLVVEITRGSISPYFWVSYILLALIIPLVSTTTYLLEKTSRNTLRITLALQVLGIAILLLVPFNFAGQYLRIEQNPLYRQLAIRIEGEITSSQLLNNYLYSPEILAFIGALGLWLLIQTIGEKQLPIQPPRRNTRT